MGKIYLLGAGIYSSLQLTIETIQAIKTCDEIYVLHDDPIVLDEIEKLNSNVIDCISFYRNRGNTKRYLIYDEIATEIIDKANDSDLTIGFIMHGHPLFLVSASEKILEKAEEKNILAITLPAISSFDTLLVDLKIDFGYAVQMYDVNFFYSNKIFVNTNTPLILFQITTFQNPNVINIEPKLEILKPLMDRLMEIYPVNHEIFIIHSASHIFEKKTLIKTTLNDFFNLKNIELWTRPTIYIPEMK